MSNSNQDLNHVLIVKEQCSERIIILNKDKYSLGRNPHNDIVIEDKQVSRYHATIIKQQEAIARDYFWIYDGDLKKRSSNGLMVNQRFCDRHCLKKGDLILLGHNVRLQYYQFVSQTLDLLKLIENKKKSREILSQLNKQEFANREVNRLTDVIMPIT